MIKLIAMDLDETLLNDDKQVSIENQKALKQAQKAGIQTVIATGRPWFSFRHTLEQIGTADQADGLSISLNGGALVKNTNGHPISVHGLSYKMADFLFQQALNFDICVHINTVDKAYGWNLGDNERQFLKGRLDIIELDKPDLSFLKDEPIVKILYGSLNFEDLQRIAVHLSPCTKDLDVSFSSNRYIEFNAGGIHKGQGLKDLADCYGLSLSECAAIGDNLNDVTMIEMAGLGIAMANAKDELKEKAGWITLRDYNHDGLAQAVEYILERNAAEEKQL